MAENKRTALYKVHKALGARVSPFGGWEMPVEYSGIRAEHIAVRTAVGLFDVSHMGEFYVRGPGACDLLQKIATNDVGRLVDGQIQYSAMARPEGTVVDDLLVYRIDSENYMMVVNAGNIQKDFEWIAGHNEDGVTVDDTSADTTLLAIQGPKAIETLGPLTGLDLSEIPFYHFATGQLAGVDGIVSRTGYTGEDGFELYFDRKESESVWAAILEAGRIHGIRPIGLGARNTLRLEGKLLLYGNDMDETTTLLEAGLGWIVKLDKGDFIGRKALEAHKAEGVRRKLVGFEMLGRDIARDHYPVWIDGVEVGHVTSGSPSITLNKNIGLAYLPVENAAIGTGFQVQVRKRLCDARVVATPFYTRRRTA